MKFRYFLALFLFSAGSLHARTWLVDNDTSRPADFRSAQAAHDGAAAGDTLLFVGSGSPYGELIISKSIHLIGPGYNLLNNAIPSANHAGVTIDLSLQSTDTQGSGASGSTFQGLNSQGTMIGSGVSNVSFDKCNLGLISCNGDIGSGRFVQNLTVKRSNISGGFYIDGGSAIIINSRIGSIKTRVLQYGVNRLERRQSALALNQCVLANGNSNIEVDDIDGHIDHSTVTISNSILFCGAPPWDGLQITNSLLYRDAANFPGTIAFSNSNSIFNFAAEKRPETPPATEQELQLNPDPSNPAKGAAVGGGDLGIFGGALPYQLSGIPSRARVTHLSTSGVVSDTVGLSVQAGGEIRP